jgi:tetratricopeptide (TPR) repeat protein
MTEEARDLRLHDPEADARMVATASVWQYLPSILLYPLRGYALGVVVVIGLMFWLFDMAGIFAVAMAPITLGWLAIYMFMIVEETALGHAIAPPLGTEVLGHNDYARLVLVIAFWFGIAALGSYLMHMGIAQSEHICMLFGLLVFPAFLVTMALENSALSALNPFNLLRFMYRTGGSYLLAVILLSTSYVLLAALSGAVSALFAHIIVVYFLVMSAHLMGFVTYHRHERLGIEVMVARPTEERARMEAQRRLLADILDQACTFSDAGNWDAARELLRREQTGLADPRLYHEELYEALRLRGQYDLSLVQGKQLIRYLVSEKRLDRALDIYEQCLDVNRRLEPEPLADCVLLAETALNNRRWPLFEKIVTDVPPRHPGNQETMALQFLHARYLAEYRQQDAAALAILKPLAVHTEHPWYSRVRALQQALERLVE